MTETTEVGETERPGSEPPARKPDRPQIKPHSLAAQLSRLVLLVILAAAGAGARALHAPSPYAAVAVWLAVAGVLAWFSMRRFWTGRGHPDRQRPAGDIWRPGDPFPEGIPAATMEAAGRILARSPGGRRAQLRILGCEDPVLHEPGLCHGAAAVPDGEGITVLLGEHAAQRRDAGFCMGHEIHHTFGWRWYLQASELHLWLTAWPIAGWALPWAWLPAALAAIQAGHILAHWLNETACDVAAGRLEGRPAARAHFAAYAAVRAQRHETWPGPAWQRHAKRLVFVLAGQADPPLWLRRAAILALAR